jgi:hypothetical protein
VLALTLERLGAIAAIRQVCGRFYPDDPCDGPVKWRPDCDADRPASFLTGDGVCAHLGGDLAVYAGARPDALPEQTFTVNDSVWTIVPESD